MRINKSVAALAAFPGGVIFEKFDFMTAFGAFDLKYRTGCPVLGILSRTFHG
jgi:hypothetical protein